MNRLFTYLCFKLLLICVFFQMGCKVKDISEVKPSGSKGSALYSFSGVVENKNVPSLRMYIHYRYPDKIVIQILSPVNSRIAAISYDSKTLLIVNYREKTAVRWLTKPFDLENILTVPLNIDDFMTFYGDYIQRSGSEINGFSLIKDWGRIIVNPSSDIVVLMNSGDRVMFKPISGLSETSPEYLRLEIPESYSYYENN